MGNFGRDYVSEYVKRGGERPKTAVVLDQVRSEIRKRYYSLRTEQSYLGWIRRFILFHGKRRPREMGTEEIEALLSDSAVRLNG